MATTHRTHRRPVAVIVLALLLSGLVACSGGGGDKADPGVQAGDGGGREAPGAGTRGDVEMVAAPGSGRMVDVAVPEGGITSIVQNVYFWKGDDNGDEPGEGSHMFMLFEPNGHADLIVENDDDRLTIGGTWEYDGGKLSLGFEDENLSTDASFDLDLEAGEVEMPFRLLSGGAEGTSTWIRTTSNPAGYLTSVFLVATGGVDDADGSEGTERAAAYAKAVIEAGGGGGKPSNLRSSGSFEGHSLRGPAAAPAQAGGGSRLDQLPDPGSIRDVETVEDSAGKVVPGEVRIWWEDGPPTVQLLWSFATPTTTPLALTPGPLSSDPRTHLPTKATGDTSSDPPNKRAVFIEPLTEMRFISWDKFSGAILQSSDGFDWSGMRSTLEDRDYDVTEVEFDDATVVGITKALLDGKAPGVVIFNTHGGTDGSLLTQDLVADEEVTTLYNAGDPGAEAPIKAAMADIKKRITDAGYADLLNYKNAAGLPALDWMAVHLGWSSANPTANFVSLTPAYWDWLREKKGLDLSRSLVYFAVCNLDQSDLRDHVQAGSFWAYNKEISPPTAGAIGSYLIESIAKPTWTAEEAFYNTVRVVNTKQETYEHDTLLDGQVPGSAGASSVPLFDPNQTPLDKGFVLNAYGWSGGKAVPYAGHGWLDPKAVSGSQVWWMLWAARWGQDPTQGAANLDTCWNEIWSTGTTGGLKSPFCNAANTGSVPTKAEVDYAKYLLTGKGAPADAVKRWTLNESP